MEGYLKYDKGEIIIAKIVFSDLTGVKTRPAFVISDLGDVLWVCGISSKPSEIPEYHITLENKDFVNGQLRDVPSYVRLESLFTLSKRLIDRKVAALKNKKTNEILKIINKTICDPTVFPVSKALERPKHSRTRVF